MTIELAILRVVHNRLDVDGFPVDVITVPAAVYHRPMPGRDPEMLDSRCGLDIYTQGQLVDRKLADKLRKPCKRCWS